MRKEIFFKYAIYGLVIALVVGVVFNTFIRNDKPENMINNTEIRYEKSTEVMLSMDPAETLNPIVSTDEDVFYLSKLLYSGLFKTDRFMTPRMDLASDYDFSGDRLSLSLKNAKFHNGDTVDGEDVEFTVKAIKAAGEKCVYYNKIKNIKDVSGSGKNVTITFEDESYMNLADLDFPIVPKDEYGRVSVFLKDTENFKPVGTGMYKYSSYDKTKALKLTGFDRYFDGKAENTVTVNVLKKGSNKVKMTESGNITVLLDKTEGRDTKINKKGIEIYNFPGNYVEFVGFNFNNKLIANKNIRKAICYAIDVENIVEEDYYNKLSQSNTFYMPGYLDVNDQKTEYVFDLDKAGVLLDKQGLTEDDEGYLVDKDGKRFTLTLVVNKNYGERADAAERIEDDLESLGIDVTVKEYETYDGYKQALKNGNFDIYIGGMKIDNSMDFRSVLKSDGEFNFGKFKDSKSDKYLNALYSGKTVSESAEVLTNYKDYLGDTVPYYCFGYKTFGIIKSDVFKGDLAASFTNPYNNIDQWHCEYQVRIEQEDEESSESSESEE